MATISGYNSYSMGVLFSGLNTTSSKNRQLAGQELLELRSTRRNDATREPTIRIVGALRPAT